jgi:hypothetical protein
VDNQHKKITGYRDLSQAEIDLMNEIKAAEATVAALVLRVQHGQALAGISEGSRQAAIARTELEGGFMRLVRAVAQPASPWVA